MSTSPKVCRPPLVIPRIYNQRIAKNEKMRRSAATLMRWKLVLVTRPGSLVEASNADYVEVCERSAMRLLN